MVAHMVLESFTYVAEGDNRSRGLVGCEFRPRTNSYDHARQVQGDAPNHQLPDWDFILARSDGSAVRLHPDWKTTNISVYAMRWHAGTFRKYEIVGQVGSLRFSKHVTFG